MTIYLGADHRGYELKEKLKHWLSENGHQVDDLGADHVDPDDDYPTYAQRVAEKVAQENVNRGIVICGSGVGVDIVANKFDGVRSGLGLNSEQIKSARADDNINVLAIAANEIDENSAIQMVKVFLETEFKEDVDRYTRRLEEIEEIEKSN